MYDAHGHASEGHAAHGPETPGIEGQGEDTKMEEANVASQSSDDLGGTKAALDSPLTQIVGVAILEFGVVLHSVFVGLTLAVDPNFKVLFVVLVFHQTFEGLGVGSRLACKTPSPTSIPKYICMGCIVVWSNHTYRNCCWIGCAHDLQP